PAILQVSSYWRHGEAIGIDFLPDCAPDWLVALKRSAPRTSPRRALGQHLPDRLAETLAERLALPAELGAATDKLLAAAQ
ncbi:aminoacetone oxidase family FAD-binding enzyme, partial [Rhizobium brockwellii]